MPHLHRRALLATSAAGAAMAAGGSALATLMPPGTPLTEPFPLSATRLLPSPFSRSLEVNRAYLMRLEPDRLLHNFRLHAGLQPKGARYGGWESDTIAGHTLGHYLSGLALLHAQTGDEEARRRVGYIVAELADCQAAAGDGYIAGFTRKRGDLIEDGKAIFPEIARGDIRATNFDLNGAWSPFYNVHKTLAGLLDADRWCAERRAIAVAAGMAGYVEAVLAPLDEAQMQRVLDCEFGGVQESFAELSARTGNRRWLKLAARFDHRKVIDPLAARRDELEGLHANTQVPKAVASARLFELTGDRHQGEASRFFWETVVRRRSYVIGGNADREYFEAPDSISTHVTEQTCETCNSYNMLKLTRLLHAHDGDASRFDFYERALYNHILVHQHPDTGMMAYMVPLISGGAREFSKPFDDFWCCVGTGMESHSKYGDSIWWKRGGGLAVNLFIPSTLDWVERGARLRLTGGYPQGSDIVVEVEALKRPAAFPLFLRIPAWCAEPSLRLNGAEVPLRRGGVPLLRDGGYAVLDRTWRAGDRVELGLPMTLRLEPTGDDPGLVALLRGPLVLAADLGPTDSPFEGPDPALVGDDLLATFEASGEGWRTLGSGRPHDLDLRPFNQLPDRRTAVYFRRFGEADWTRELARREAEHRALIALDARSLDVVRLGDDADEKAHGLDAKTSYAVVYRRRQGRDARAGGHFEFTAKVASDRPVLLRAAYWGEERNRAFSVLVDGVEIGRERLDDEAPGRFIERDYPIPPALTRGKDRVRIRFEPAARVTAGPVFGVRVLPA